MTSFSFWVETCFNTLEFSDAVTNKTIRPRRIPLVICIGKCSALYKYFRFFYNRAITIGFMFKNNVIYLFIFARYKHNIGFYAIIYNLSKWYENMNMILPGKNH